jgi:hypothetical protein
MNRVQNPIIPNVIHNHENSLESISAMAVWDFVLLVAAQNVVRKDMLCLGRYSALWQGE